MATATVIANTSDPEASLRQINGVVSLKFKSAGANIVIPVGQAGQTWGNATASGSYHPQVVAPNYNAFSAYTTERCFTSRRGQRSERILPPLSVGTKAVGWT